MATKSTTRVRSNVTAQVFVAKVLRQAEAPDGCLDKLAENLGLAPKSAYQRYAKYRKEMKEATGTELPKLSQSATRKANIDWSSLAAMVNAPTLPEAVDEVQAELETEAEQEAELESEVEMTEAEAEEIYAESHA
jgi:hypothetical protein